MNDKYYDTQTNTAWKCLGYLQQTVKALNSESGEFIREIAAEKAGEVEFHFITHSRRFKNMHFLSAKCERCPEGYEESKNIWAFITD